jgi:pimeloyl-ACP methyl ester carboxylesterase
VARAQDSSADRLAHLPQVDLRGPDLPDGRRIQLEGRGEPFVRELPGPGTPGAPTLVLLHGWTATSDLNWFTTFGALGEQAHVLALDHRGHGQGIRTTDRFRLVDCADDVIALADALGIEQVVPVGYSMGGAVAQLVAHRHPDRVAGLVLCATARTFTGAPRSQARVHLMHAAAQALRLTPEPMRIRLSREIVARRSDDSPIRDWADAELRQNDVRMMAEAGVSLARFTSNTWIGDVDVPAAVVVTMEDRVVPTRRQLKLATRLPGATVHEVPGGEHSACVLQPEAFRSALVQAVQSVTARVHWLEAVSTLDTVGSAAPSDHT